MRIRVLSDFHRTASHVNSGNCCQALDIRQKFDRYFSGQVTPFNP